MCVFYLKINLNLVNVGAVANNRWKKKIGFLKKMPRTFLKLNLLDWQRIIMLKISLPSSSRQKTIDNKKILLFDYSTSYLSSV